MWTNSSEELVLQEEFGAIKAKAYLAFWNRKERGGGKVKTEDSGDTFTYYTFRIEMAVGEYLFNNYGDVGHGKRMYFANKKNALGEVKRLFKSLMLENTTNITI